MEITVDERKIIIMNRLEELFIILMSKIREVVFIRVNDKSVGPPKWVSLK